MSDKKKHLGIEETLDIFDYADVVLEKLVYHKSDDGKIDGGEITSTMVTTVPDAVQAIIGAGDVQAELKDLDKEELITIANRGAKLAQCLVALFTKK